MTFKINLSPNFTVQECQRSDYADLFNINNALPPECYKGAVLLAINVLEPIRAEFGAFTPLSWYRCPKVNKGIGGSDTSDHMKGIAVDMRIIGVPLIKLATWISENLEFDQVILEPNWVHASFRQEGNRREIKTRFIINKKIVYKPGFGL